MYMELSQLKYFVRVAELESISAAAESLHISQPALSKSISKLEGELGIALFDRVGKYIVLNEPGRYFLSCAKRSLYGITEARAMLEKYVQQGQNLISIGLFASSDMVLDCINKYTEQFPDITFSINCNIGDLLANGFNSFDMVIFPDSPEYAAYKGIPLYRETTGIVVPCNHTLANERQLSLSAFRDEYFVFLENDANIYETHYKYCLNAGFSPKIRYITRSSMIRDMLVQKGMAVGFSSHISEYAYDSNIGLHFISLEENLSSRQILLGFKRNNLVTSVARSFYLHALSYFHICYDENTFSLFDKRTHT